MRSRSRLMLVLAFGATVLIFSVVLFQFYAEEIRIHVLRPAIEAYFIGRYYLEFVPQLILWMIPLLLASAIVIRQIVRRPRQARSIRAHPTQVAAPGEGELARLARQIHRAHHSRFSRVRLSRTLVEIGARLIAAREATSLSRARQRLAGGYWSGAGSVHRFLTPRRHYTAHQSSLEFERSLRETVEHLEEFDQHG